jgi:hypothetical protein
MGSGDPSGLQNRRELALLALVSSTLTRFRHYVSNKFVPALALTMSISLSAPRITPMSVTALDDRYPKFD